MEDNRESSPKCSIIIHEDPTEVHNIQPTECPLCKAVVQLYQISFEEKFLMCGNINCPYPFGITDYHFYKVDCDEEDIRPDSRNSGGCSGGSTVTSGSMSESDDEASTPPWSVIEEMQAMEKLAKLKEIKRKEKLLHKKFKRLEELNKELIEKDEDLDLVLHTLQSILSLM